MEGTAMLWVTRDPASWQDRARSYELLLDDQPLGQIRDGQTISCQISATDHTFRVKVDWAGSPEVTFTARPEEEIS
jgi:hypothetical protein